MTVAGENTGKALGFVGVGKMGAHMASRLLKAGHTLTIFDVDERAVASLEKLGAKRAKHPKEVASSAEVVLVSLPTPDIVRNVALGENGIVHGTRVRTYVDLSTTGPKAAKEVAAALAERNIIAVDAPVSGGPAGAERGTLAVMVACPQSTFDQLKPALDILGKVFLVGEQPGMGQTMKLVNNILSATAFAISSEALVMGAKAGLDPDTMLAIVNVSSGRNTATEDKFPRCVLPRRFDFGFSVGLMLKDVTLGLEFAESMGVPMMVGNATKQLLAITAADRGPGADLTTAVCTVEEWAKTEVKGVGKG